jgi:hypothetical protein
MVAMYFWVVGWARPLELQRATAHNTAAFDIYTPRASRVPRILMLTGGTVVTVQIPTLARRGT